ncbi:hypothetical protein PH5382_03815 [Phaeobacter sp. CECT 5382]|uniref:hypothetical protein n=1 Tax=Phaeobacter sp. CECT 5382 TaxID=1712645 RepID=UPI0006DA79DB|nr:hypothetical protein [Phaeobacter sp. CECT 5382]CUH89862.1 hypothetical protein PH5382_03815 [Phaeobacter sp. CECT 5382]
MSDQDILEVSELVEEHDNRNEDDEDDYYSIALYRHSDGRMFRYVAASGMNSVFGGAQGFIDQWLAEREVASWIVVG